MKCPFKKATVDRYGRLFILIRGESMPDMVMFYAGVGAMTHRESRWLRDAINEKIARDSNAGPKEKRNES